MHGYTWLFNHIFQINHDSLFESYTTSFIICSDILSSTIIVKVRTSNILLLSSEILNHIN